MLFKTLVKPIFLFYKQCKLIERQTSPPDYLTESELISLMEKHGIGTDASIPVHINNICERNYVQVIGGRKLQPTTLGIVLVHGYIKVRVFSVSEVELVAHNFSCWSCSLSSIYNISYLLKLCSISQ